MSCDEMINDDDNLLKELKKGSNRNDIEEIFNDSDGADDPTGI